VYFRNLIFDGQGTAEEALLIRAAQDVVFDQVTFRNFLDPKVDHAGLVSGSGMLDNIWFRGVTFEGNERYAIYLDGIHGSGVVDSQIDSAFGSGGLLFLGNDDFSEDYDGDGVWEPNERRISNYIVVDGNTFGTSGSDRTLHTGVSVTGANALVRDNTTFGNMVYLAEFVNRCSLRWPQLQYEQFGHVVKGNRVQSVDSLVMVDGTIPANCDGSVPGLIGHFTVKGNITASPPRSGSMVSERSEIEGPNSVIGNHVRGVSDRVALGGS
jgi:hypothetical protein